MANFACSSPPTPHSYCLDMRRRSKMSRLPPRARPPVTTPKEIQPPLPFYLGFAQLCPTLHKAPTQNFKCSFACHFDPFIRAEMCRTIVFLLFSCGFQCFAPAKASFWRPVLPLSLDLITSSISQPSSRFCHWTSSVFHGFPMYLHPVDMLGTHSLAATH